MPDNKKPSEPVEEERRGLKNFPTAQLVEELCSREGVVEHRAEPYETIVVNAEGPARILVVTD